jgi:hypothetical protein
MLASGRLDMGVSKRVISRQVVSIDELCEGGQEKDIMAYVFHNCPSATIK